ncbi:ABC transporter substrate-binding protein [Streptococcus equi subsp. zooepidemicus]|uniref:tryptophan ABC transporter substrate-binding protein n=1 Tax=Streptococcus equi TaxID=1336 RepID=UPI0002174456|nr:tryptophan ABC transporter substrate-binding protein [Streptococcus equi]AEJ25523.1 exported protein [Streptococcus equi subsp. zooepidemicus ATCC 35246]AIA67412.1 peptide ABC transporter substrate-binding protein [Streptococcus equi subsp. zooepidemicus CY]MBR7683174.1 ABC transporter substrate-binding protein [Streptococcus equi subsp. zooepidemicus]MBR7752153.1 ABC transporter substrate-binding protein [Streptococcus equi subsp. zooepidemicus]MBR7775328.1 ABC transporter substrate-bindin
MKHKGLIATVIVLFLMVAASLVLKEGKKQSQLASKHVVKVGILQLVTHEALDQIAQGIKDELKKHHQPEQKVSITLMNAEGDQSKIQTMSRQLVKTNDIVVGIATPAAQGLAAATETIPVVMSAISDPVGAKLVKHLDRPEANVTGLSNKVPVRQTVDLIKEMTPQVKRVGVLYASSEDNSISQVKDFTALAEKQGLEVLAYAVPSTNEVTTTMSVMTEKVDAIFIPQDNTIASAFSAVVAASNAAQLPVYSSVDTMVEQGSLASISQSQYQLGVETARQVLQLMAGKEVSEVPVKVVDNGKPFLNVKVARDLGLVLSKDLLKRSDLTGKQ